MTWPPLSSRSYFCCADTQCSRCARSRVVPIAPMALARVTPSPPTILVPPGGPLRGEILAHVERARHLIPVHVAGEPEAQGVAVPLRVAARDLNLRAVDAAGEIARDEVALMRPLEAAAPLAPVPPA